MTYGRQISRVSPSFCRFLNATALQLAVNYSDQALEVYDILLTLVESEMSILATKCGKVMTEGNKTNISQTCI
jgi:hypothetical protein